MLRASEVWRVRHCLPSVRLSEQVKGTPQEAPTEEIAEEGTEQHEDLAEGKDSYLQYLATKETERWAEGQPYRVYREQELYLRHDDLEPYFVGHPDLYLIREDGYYGIWDFKTGPRLELDAWADQLDCYEVLVDENQETIGGEAKVISLFHGVVEPLNNVPHIDKWFLRTLAQAVNSPSNAFNPGLWCRYCPGRLACEVAQTTFEQPLQLVEMPVGERGAEILGKLKLLKKLVAEKITAYENLVRQNPATLANRWEVGPGKRPGEIASITQAVQLLAPHFTDTRGMLEATGKLSYAKLRDLLSEERGIGAKDAEAALKDILGELLTFKETKGAVVETQKQIE